MRQRTVLELRIAKQCKMLIIALLAFPFALAQHTDHPYVVEPTPTLGLEDYELTTVLLVSNDNKTASHGRYLNVRPNVGLLTSTARTFIQEGVTTEYATQVLGTTLENGRIYAQLLKKSSRVLYDKESAIAPSIPNINGGVVHTSIVGEENRHQIVYPQPRFLLQSHNDLVADKDWQDIDDRIVLEKNSFVGNTDFVGSLPKRSHTVFPAALPPSGEKKEQEVNGDLFGLLPSSGDSSKATYETVAITANKVQQTFVLPTYTVKNMFSPSGFSLESSQEAEEQKHNFENISMNIAAFSIKRSPNQLYHKIMKDEQSILLSTVTYYGFADFTTVVGDSVIVFSPSTSAQKIPSAQVTSIKGKATLGPQEASNVSKVPITITQDQIAPTFVIPMLSTEVGNINIMATNISIKSKEVESEQKTKQIEDKYIDHLNHSEEQNNEQIQITTDISTTEQPALVTVADVSLFYNTKDIEEKSHNEENILTTPSTTEYEEDQTDTKDAVEKQDTIFDLSSIVEENSFQTPTQTKSQVMFSRPSDEEISRIYSSLAKAESILAMQKSREMSSMMIDSINPSTKTINDDLNIKIDQLEENAEELTTTEKADIIQPDVNVEGGATTVFYEDDPFLEFVSQSATEKVTIQQSQLPNITSQLENESILMDNLTEFPVTDSSLIEEDTTVVSSTESNTDDQIHNQDEFQPIIKEIKENEEVENCVRTSQVYLTQIPKTITHFTTFFISNGDESSTSVETNTVASFDIGEATKHYCIQSSKALSQTINSMSSVIERPPAINSNINDFAYQASNPMTTDYVPVTDSPEDDSIESDDESYDDETEKNEEDEDDRGNLESEEEIEFVYKTLYTTYTYLTTFFHDSTTSVSSHKEIVTNIITSGMSSNSLSSTEPGAIEPTATILSATNLVAPIPNEKSIFSNTKFELQSSDLIKIDDILREDFGQASQLTEKLDDSKIVRTYFTTYTYYTTIFVDGETEIMSRTEIHSNVLSNVLGKSELEKAISPSARNLQIDYTSSDEDNAVIDLNSTPTYDPIQKTVFLSNEQFNFNDSQIQELKSSSSTSSSRSEKKVVAIKDSNSNTKGQNQLVENRILDDQISSESNTEEILPSATLLLQTSFTTFTYYTTMYGNETTNVVSRLETITNIVTETLQPTKTLSADEATLPITYFTTFTYWTKLAKEGKITTLSREETVLNVVTPSISDLNESHSISIFTSQPTLESTTALPSDGSESSSSLNEFSKAIDLTTYYTTYTYYTTLYADDKTVTDSRFETVTNVFNPSSIISSLPQSMGNTNRSADETTKSSINTSMSVQPSPQTLSFDFKTIIDAEGISTLYFKTQLIATVIDATPTQILSSTSTIKIDEVNKASLAKNNQGESELASTKTYKTGLVRLIKGTKLTNQTTTVYQSKVIGTFIDQRYAQVIESTSSFILGKTLAPSSDLEATSTLNPTTVQPTALVASVWENNIESSITDVQNENKNPDQDGDGDDESDTENENTDDTENENAADDESNRPRTRLSFQTKKKTFTPVIRPFVSRNRPQFAPRRKNILQSTATIITRSDLTPTITATPAIKSDVRGRFSSSRKSNIGPSSGISSQGIKKFGRPIKSSQFGSSSSYPGSSSRNRLQSSRESQSGYSSNYNSFIGLSNSRRIGASFRGSSTSVRLLSSAFPGNSRLRIRPSSSLPYDDQSSTASYNTISADNGDGEDSQVTQRYDSDEETDFTTDSQRRNNNNILRLRRPQLNRSAFQIGLRRNSLNTKPRTTTSTSTTTTQRPRQKPGQRPTSFAQIQNRAWPQNNLFPSRRRFQSQNLNQSFDEEQSFGGDNEFESETDDSSDYENDEGIDEQEQEEINRRRRSESISTSRRHKRQANNFRNRFRRPSTTKLAAEERVENPIEDESSSTVRSRASSRFTPRTHAPAHASSQSTSSNKPQHNNRAIRPTKPNSNNRAQFTLREKDTTTKHTSPRLSNNFRRPLPNTGSSSLSSRRTTTAASRPKAPRIKNYGNSVKETTHTSAPRGRTTASGRSRSTARTRSRIDITTDSIIPAFDGTITVTHTTPSELTVPIVNGQVTEYKNVLTTTTSTEIVSPNQYTTIIGQLGSSTLVLNREETSVNLNGATEVTQFILHELPTTSVIFTPTTIRGRKTSFAHMIPSTAYQVENVISTMQPQIAANAPLANILLSQLLLGNLGSINQPNINPLLALGAATQANPAIPGVPTTEYKTRSSTYVTTVTNGMSTVIPLTFHGKEILTTIYDSSSDVITATEYFTETIVITPTFQSQQVQQVNSLLLPYLLQQQLQSQGQQLPSQPVIPIQNSIPPQLLFPDNLQDIDHNSIQKYNDYSPDIEDYPNSQDEQIVESSQNINTKSNTHNSQRIGGRKKGGRKIHKPHVSTSTSSDIESSVITLYVSGRRPGEFSTILSTVHTGIEPSLRKRQINRVQPFFRSKAFDDFEDYYSSDGSEIEEFLLPASKDITANHNLKSNFLPEETQSLESIVGDVSIWNTKISYLHANESENSESSTVYEDLLSQKSISGSRSDLVSLFASPLDTKSAQLMTKHSGLSTQSKPLLV